MAERTTVTQICQFGVESTKGTAVAANKYLPSLMLDFGIAASFTEVRASGNKFPGLEVIGKEWSSLKAPNQPTTYNELPYILSSLLSYAAPVQIATSGAYTWTHGPASSAEDTVKSFTVEQGSAFRAHKASYVQAMAMTLAGDRDKVDMSADFVGQAISDGVTLTVAPTSVGQIPILAKDVTLYNDSASGGLGTTKMARVLSWELAISNKVGPLWVVDKSLSSFAALVETPVDAHLKFMVEADAEGMAHLTNMRADTRRFFRVEAVSNSIAGTTGTNNYKATIDIAGEISEQPSSFSDKDGVFAIEYNYKLVHDTTWGKAMTSTVVNSQTAL